MPRFAVRPDDLEDAAALTSSDASALDVVRRMVAASGREALGALGVSGGPLPAAVEGYAQVESAVTLTLAEVSGVLGTGLGSAARAYASADTATGRGFDGGP